jgi:hypothetical protein
MDADYCKSVLGLYFPFCMPVDEIATWESVRYWSREYNVTGFRLRVTSQWYEYQRDNFCRFLISKNIYTCVDLTDLEGATPQKAARVGLHPSRGGVDANAAFRDWLVAQGYPEHSISSRLSNVRRVEEFYGDLDGHYARDRLAGLLACLRYSTQNERRGRPNPTLIPINGNIRNNLATYSSGVMLYARYASQRRREAEWAPSRRWPESSWDPGVGRSVHVVGASATDSPPVPAPALAENSPSIGRVEQKVHRQVETATRTPVGAGFSSLLRAKFHSIMSLFGDKSRRLGNATKVLRVAGDAGHAPPVTADQDAASASASASASEPMPQGEELIEFVDERPHSSVPTSPSPVEPLFDGKSANITHTEHRYYDDAGPLSGDKIRRWAGRPYSNVHKIVAIALSSVPITRDRLVEEIQRRGISRNAYGAIASLKTNGGNAYGRIFVEQAGYLYFHPEIEEVIRSYKWRHP